MALQLRGECDGSAEEENAVQRIDDDHDDRVAGPVDVERGRDQVDQREHSEHRYIDGVVHGRRVPGEGFGDHVTDEGHNEQSP